MSPDYASNSPKRAAAARVARHRLRAATSGVTRVEVSVPARDASLVRALARTLRDGGDDALGLRRKLAKVVRPATARTGAELVAFLRASPLRGVDLAIERDRSPGRKPVEFE